MNIDTSKPNISRIYDYVLGGHHNFEVDRMAANQILQVFPSYPRWARLNRWFLQMVATRWGANNYNNILDLGSGMPTQDHFHSMIPGAKVLYTDNDDVTVAFAKEVVGHHPDVSYLQVDIRDMSSILNSADQFFGGERTIAIGCIGIAYFVDEQNLSAMLRALYDWSAPGTEMALSFLYSEMTTDANRAALEFFRRSGVDIFSRDEAAMRRIAAPWHFDEVKPLATWLNVEHMIQESDREGSNAEMYGAILRHKK